MTGMYSGIDDAPVGGDRLYFEPGNYRVKIDMIKSVHPDKAFDGIGSFIVECVILHSTCATRKPGAVVGWVQKLHKDPKKGGLAMAFGRVKAFFAAALKTTDLDAAVKAMGFQSFEAFAETASSEANPLRGVIVDLACNEKKRPEGKGPITTHAWHPEGTLAFS